MPVIYLSLTTHLPVTHHSRCAYSLSYQELLAPTARDLMRTLGDVVWHTPPPPLAILCDGTATAATNSDADKVTADGSTEEGGGRGLCVSSVSVCGEGGEWAWGDDAVSMARLPL